MRSALILAAIALTAFSAPLPVVSYLQFPHNTTERWIWSQNEAHNTKINERNVRLNSRDAEPEPANVRFNNKREPANVRFNNKREAVPAKVRFNNKRKEEVRAEAEIHTRLSNAWTHCKPQLCPMKSPSYIAQQAGLIHANNLCPWVLLVLYNLLCTWNGNVPFGANARSCKMLGWTSIYCANTTGTLEFSWKTRVCRVTWMRQNWSRCC